MYYDFNGNPVNPVSETKQSKFKNNGVLNSLMLAKQYANLKWKTTASGMPNGNNGTLANNAEVTGLPYSSASVEDGYIGLNVSLYAFLTALHDPNSCLYSEVSKGYTGYAYYGTVCTSFVCAAWGIPVLITTAAMRKVVNDLIVQIDKADIELGDMLLSSTHAKLVTGIKRDSTGTITHVQLAESKYNQCIENTTQTYSDFVSNNTAFTAYRYKKIMDAETYIPSPLYDLPDEGAETMVYSDIVTYYGDRVTRKKGTDIPIHVLNATGYTSIKTYKDGVLYDTASSVSNFTLTDLEPGVYEVRMEGTGKTASTFFDIVDAHASISSNTLTFDTTYEAVAVGGYPTYTINSSGQATSWNNPKRVHLVTDAENTARSVDISEMTGDSDCNGGIRLYVKGAYGTVSFEFPYSS